MTYGSTQLEGRTYFRALRAARWSICTEHLEPDVLRARFVQDGHGNIAIVYGSLHNSLLAKIATTPTSALVWDDLETLVLDDTPEFRAQINAIFPVRSTFQTTPLVGGFDIAVNTNQNPGRIDHFSFSRSE